MSLAFGELVRVHREKRGWKQEGLATRWGYTREYISMIECGKRKLNNGEQIARLMEILGITHVQFFQAGMPSQLYPPSPKIIQLVSVLKEARDLIDSLITELDEEI